MAVFGPPGGVGDSGLPELWPTDGEETGEAARGADFDHKVSDASLKAFDVNIGRIS